MGLRVVPQCAGAGQRQRERVDGSRVPDGRVRLMGTATYHTATAGNASVDGCPPSAAAAATTAAGAGFQRDYRRRGRRFDGGTAVIGGHGQAATGTGVV